MLLYSLERLRGQRFGECQLVTRYPILGVKPGWRPDHFDYLLQQIEWAAETVFGPDYAKYRHLWMRKGVFFPFSQYSIMLAWTWWDLPVAWREAPSLSH